MLWQREYHTSPGPACPTSQLPCKDARTLCSTGSVFMADNDYDVILQSLPQPYLMSALNCNELYLHPCREGHITNHRSNCQVVTYPVLREIWETRGPPPSWFRLRKLKPSSQMFVMKDLVYHSQSHGTSAALVATWPRAMMDGPSPSTDMIFCFPHKHNDASVLAPRTQVHMASSWLRMISAAGQVGAAIERGSGCAIATSLLQKSLCQVARDLTIALAYYSSELVYFLAVMAAALAKDGWK